MLAEYLENNTYNNADTKFDINESVIAQSLQGKLPQESVMVETESRDESYDSSHADNVPLPEKNGGKQAKNLSKNPSKNPSNKSSKKQQKKAPKKSRVEGAFDEYSSILAEIQSINAYIGGNIGAPVNFSDVDDDELYDNVGKSQESSSFSINSAII